MTVIDGYGSSLPGGENSSTLSTTGGDVKDAAVASTSQACLTSDTSAATKIQITSSSSDGNSRSSPSDDRTVSVPITELPALAQKQVEASASLKQFFADTMKSGGGLSKASRVALVVHRSNEALEWLKGKGVWGG